jgi:hypothetical protein
MPVGLLGTRKSLSMKSQPCDAILRQFIQYVIGTILCCAKTLCSGRECIATGQRVPASHQSYLAISRSARVLRKRQSVLWTTILRRKRSLTLSKLSLTWTRPSIKQQLSGLWPRTRYAIRSYNQSSSFIVMIVSCCAAHPSPWPPEVQGNDWHCFSSKTGCQDSRLEGYPGTDYNFVQGPSDSTESQAQCESFLVPRFPSSYLTESDCPRGSQLNMRCMASK